MWNLLQGLGGQSSTPVRRKMTVLIRQDPRTGEISAIPIEGQETTLSAENSPDTVTARFESYFKCGHHAASDIGGQCFECEGTSCVACHRQCACGKPLCSECAVQEEGCEVGRVLCAQCFDVARRRRRVKRIVGVLFGPFVDRGDPSR